MRELPVLFPPEGDRSHTVHHNRDGHEGQVDDLHPSGSVVGKVLPPVEAPERQRFFNASHFSCVLSETSISVFEA